jgi:hypothetical protein
MPTELSQLIKKNNYIAPENIIWLSDGKSEKFPWKIPMYSNPDTNFYLKTNFTFDAFR